MAFSYIDIFAGAGGLSEGFQRNGFLPVAHVEMNKQACLTLKTRECFYYLKKHGQLEDYYLHIRWKTYKVFTWVHSKKRLIIKLIK